MLEIGNRGQWGAKENMTTAERRSHMALWCIFAAPLILGGDVRTMAAGDLAIVANPKLIRIDQDPVGRQGRCLRGCAKSLQPWAAAALANFTAQNSAQRQIFPVPGPPLSLSRVRLGIFSQYSRWQPLVREIEFQTSDGVWKKNSAASCAPNRTGGLVAGASGFVAPDAACLAADGNLSTHWNARADQDQRYWIDFDFGGVVSLKAIAVTQGTDDVHQMKDFGLLPAPHGPGHESVQLWTKTLADTSVAVLLFNADASVQRASFNMSEIGLQCEVGDVESVWAVSNATQRLSVVTAAVESHDTAGFICSCSTRAMPVVTTAELSMTATAESSNVKPRRDSFQLPTSSMKIDDTEAAFRPPVEPRILQGETDWAAFLSRSDPINTFNISEPMTVPDIWLESAFLGNGMLGCQVLVCPGGICTQSLLLGTNTTLPSLDAPHQVVIPLARADVADTRTGNASAACTEFHGKVNCFNLADQYARPRLGVGALILRQTSGTIVGGSIRTHLHNASISARIRTTQGDVDFNVFVHATRQLIVVQGLRGSGGERHTQLRFDFVPAPAVSPVQFEAKRTAGAFTRFTGSPLPGHYAPNPPALCSGNSCRQSLLVSKEGRGWVTSWRSGSGGQLLLTVTSDIPVRVGIAPKTTRASVEAASVLAAAVALDPSSLVAEHAAWWAHLYWSDSSGAFVSLPEAAAKVEQFHWITLLKVASENACRRFVDSAFPPGILDNCLLLDGLNFVGPMQKTKYPFAIWDMNVEGAQWGGHSSNLPEQSLALARRIPEQLSNFIASVPRAMRNDSASINVETASLSFLAECMVQHCDSDAFPLCVNNFSAVQDLPDEACLQRSGSLAPQNFYGGLPWVCHSIWLVYRHTMDESILRDLLPLLKRSTNLYMRTAHVGADEKLHLPLMESPEYGEAADTSFDHALFRWCLRTLIRTSTLLPNSSTDLEVQKWQNTLRKLSAPRIDPATGSLMIGANLSLHSSNKHFSHLFSIFPLGLQDWSVEAERELWTKSLAVFKHYNDPTVSDEGFTYLGMAIITAWARPALPGGAPASWADSVLGNVSHFFRVPQLGSGTMYADHAACGPVAGCREGMAGPCNESPILASLALQQMLLQSWNGVPIGIFPAVPASWADARFARMRAEGAVLVTAVRANFTTVFFSLNATVGGNVSVHSTIVDLASSNAEVLVTASPIGEAGVFAVSVSHSKPWAAVFYSKARGPPSSEKLGLALTPLPAGEVNLWGSRPAGSGPPIPPGPPPPGPLGPLPRCPTSGCAHCGGCHWPYANDTMPDPKQPVLSSVVATTVACEAKCGSMAAPGCAGFTRKEAENVCYFYSKSQVSGLFSHLRPDVSWHPNPHAETRVD